MVQTFSAEILEYCFDLFIKENTSRVNMEETHYFIFLYIIKQILITVNVKFNHCKQITLKQL